MFPTGISTSTLLMFGRLTQLGCVPLCSPITLSTSIRFIGLAFVYLVCILIKVVL